MKVEICRIPTRIDLVSTWIDQPYLSYLAPSWALSSSLEPTLEVRDRGGLPTSTCKVIQKNFELEK